MNDAVEDEILRDLRRVSRAIDLYSRKLASQHQLTGPQLVCLRQLTKSGPLPPSQLAREVSLSHATVTGIVTRLESRGLVHREKSTVDRRRVDVSLTDKGVAVLESAPYPLQDRFVRRLHALSEANRRIIAIVLSQVVGMMDAEELDAAPLLTTGPVTATPEHVEELLAEPTRNAPQDDDPGPS